MGVNRIIRKTVLPCLFFGKTKATPPVVEALSENVDQESQIGTSESNDVRTGEVLKVHVRERSGGGFPNADHVWNLSEERRDRKQAQDVVYKSRLKGLVNDLKVTDKRLLLCAKITGAWLSVRVATVSGTVLSGTECRNFLYAC